MNKKKPRKSKIKDPQHHLVESEAIVLFFRKELGADIILIDELAARTVAKELGVKLTGFPGILLKACKDKIITALELKSLLKKCQEEGTRYSNNFIQAIYNKAKDEY
ncbi:MAG: hypothetical protein ACE5KT_08560 [Methanosarcinales archaeon]